MKRSLLFALAALVCGLTQAQEPYQVPGFPPFAPAPKMLEVVEDRGDTVLVRHLMGETEIPKNPERVFTDGSGLEPMLALGVKPVGSNITYTPADMPPRLAPQLEGITLLERAITNLEAVLALEPDVIIAWDVIALSSDAQTLYQQLSAIAPTVVLAENPYTFWEAAIRDLGEVFGLDGAAKEALEAYRQEAETLCKRIRQAVGNGTLSVLNVNPREVRLFGAGYETTIYDTTNNVSASSTGYIPYGPTVWTYNTCRLTPGPEVARLAGTVLGAPLSFEALPDLGADYLLVMTMTPEDETVLTDHLLWAQVPAVKAGQVYHTGVLTAVGPYTSRWALEQAADALAADGTSSLTDERYAELSSRALRRCRKKMSTSSRRGSTTGATMGR